MSRRVAVTLAISCIVLLSTSVSAATKKKARPSAPAAAVPAPPAIESNLDSLATEPMKASDSPLVRAAKAARLVRTQNAADGRTTTSVTDWKPRSLGTLGPAVSPQGGSLATAGLYDKRGSGPYPSATQRPAAEVRRDMERNAAQLLEPVQDDEDEGAAERRMEQLNIELRNGTPAKGTPPPPRP
ncbi:MAG TPA: hypothetical protein VNM92_07875 [Thermoanaerobaculia bacterium]|nr:hypothetical protein [Thermoanaerobaculia bacterium]